MPGEQKFATAWKRTKEVFKKARADEQEKNLQRLESTKSGEF